MLEISSLECQLPGWGTELTRAGRLGRLLGGPFPMSQQASEHFAFDEEILGWLAVLRERMGAALKVTEKSLESSF